MNEITSFAIQADRTDTPCKPSSKQIPKIQYRLCKVIVSCLQEFGEMMTPPHSFTWSGALMPNGRKAANWISQQVFALDFDSGITPEEAIKIGIEKDLVPNLIYTSFSDSPELRKFRFVYVLDHSMEEPEGAKKLILYLMAMFPMADKMCKDISRMFYGGKSFTIHSEVYHSLQEIYIKTDTYFMEIDTNKSRKITKSVKSRQALGKDRGFREIPSEESIALFKKNKKFDHPDWSEFAEDVIIFKDFLEGKWLYHKEIFGLATSLHWFNGGQKLMKNTMEKHNRSGKTKYTENNFSTVIYAARVKYFPMKLSDFSPYVEDHNLDSFAQLARIRRGTIEKIWDREPTPIETVETAMDNFIDQFMDPASLSGLYILNVPTGIGKTRKLSQLEDVIIAVPTHKLKDELLERMNKPTVGTIGLPCFSSNFINKKLKDMYKRGNFTEPLKTLKQISKNQDNKYRTEDSEKAQEYLYSRTILEKVTTDNIITTHSRILSQKFLKETLIFDEDPLKSLLKISDFTINDLINYNWAASQSEKSVKRLIKKIEGLIEKCESGIIYQTPDFNQNLPLECIEDSLSGQDIKGNLNGFIHSYCYMRDLRNPARIHYLVKNSLPENKKILISSATVDKYFYEKLYGNDMIMQSISFPRVKQNGKIIQETGLSCSRSSIREKLDSIKNHIGDFPILSFSEFNSEFNREKMDIYFGNCSGYDFLSGKNLNVVGTPHLNPAAYLLTAYALGIKVNDLDWEIIDRMVERKCHKFKFKTYEDKELQYIQFHMIECELIQAVGRSRTLRNDCEVRLFSNLPLQMTTEFTLNLN
ncbi:hypothetical protein [Algoriphagus antarcticus]|uniref:Uncharacterized protein n=1 Tax=Algoriphagus antarcticus TaxID=238540 RepID=A0A3E0E331_9BACT|nr:hypothetical protein [Algoriphagus antarcticus]REG92143.1 hypothetical protein C8N25_103222 [Algoriphagus antarcticus]